MALKANKFRLGLFFSIGVILLISIILWLTGGFKHKQVVTYACYFEWSVQGLNEGGNVLYNGVPVGKIKTIKVAPDGDLVEVIVDIEKSFTVTPTIVATLQMTGITGLKSMNLSHSATSVSPPNYPFAEYPVIPVNPGAVQAVTTTFERITEIIHEVNFEEVGEEVTTLLHNVNTILDGDMIENIEESILRNSHNLDTLLIAYTRLARNLDSMVVNLDTPQLAGSIDSLMTRIDGFVEPFDNFMIQLNEITVETNNLIETMRFILEILQNGPGEFMIPTSGEGVWQ